ncbi:TPA: hypothetical protein HA249_04885 [Candidatus Woesearchaeota archaeon]|nr:MAG: hypothetical protein QT07_C0001G0013 [archaeon GW2011_AR16]HIG96190.1 hypothetical protein [Candidatus Woesearchaeota archaeon]HIH47020.1 hypothetical protein [Candidatus Woesearchaeota archaeon]
MARIVTPDEKSLVELCHLEGEPKEYDVVESPSFVDVYQDVTNRKLRPYFMRETDFIATATKEIDGHLMFLKGQQGETASYVACMVSERTRKDNARGTPWSILYKLFVRRDCTSVNGTPMAWPRIQFPPKMTHDELSDWTVLQLGGYAMEYEGVSFESAWKKVMKRGYKPERFRKPAHRQLALGLAPTTYLNPWHRSPYLALLDQGIVRGIITSEGIDLPTYRLYLRI